MSIYSVNRTGSMALAQVAANESYTSEDFGRILYETQVNDMAFFEAVLACDFNEIKSLNEGTLLESEIEALNEASFKAIGAKLIDRLKKFWEKIKGIFKNSIDKVSTYIVTNCKNFVKEFKEKVDNKINSWDGSIEARIFNHNHKVFEIDSNHITTIMKQDYQGDREVNAADITVSLLGYGPREYTTRALEACSSNVTFNKSNVNELVTGLIAGKDHIDSLRNKEKAAGAAINRLIAELKNDMSSDNEEAKNSTIRLNAIVSAYEAYITITTRAAIQAVRMDIKSRRTAMVKVMADIVKTPKEIKEAYVLEASDEFDFAMSNEYNEGLELNDDIKAEINALVNED